MEKKRFNPYILTRTDAKSRDQFAKTPQDLYSQLNEEFNFDFDPCPENPQLNGLIVPWG